MSDPFRNATTTSEEEEEEREIHSSSGAMGKKTKSKKSHKKNKRIRTSPDQQQQQQQERSKIEPESVQQKPDRDVEHRRPREETNYFDPRELERYQQVNRTPKNNSKMCSFCLITGHATSDCDLRRQCKILNKLRCEFCESYGHSIDDCPIYGREICSFCGLKGHDHERCEILMKAMKGSQNAIKKSPPEAKKCTFCGDKGHNDEHCPKKEVERKRSSLINNSARTSSSIHSYTESKNNIKKNEFEENNKEKTSHESKREKCTFCGKNGHDDECCPEKERVRENSLNSIYSPSNLDNWSSKDSATTFSSIHSQTKSESNIKTNELEENNEKNITFDNKAEECTFCGIEGHNDEHCSMKEEAREKPMMNNFFTVPSDTEERNSNFYSKPVRDNECTLQLKQDKGNSSDSERNLLQGPKSYLMQSINAVQSFFGRGSKPSDSDFENDEKQFQEVKYKKKNKILECELCSERGHKKENCPIPKELEKLDLCDEASKQEKNETLICELCLNDGHEKENCPMVKELEKSGLYDQENEDYKPYSESYSEYDKKKESYPVDKGLGKYENNDSFDHRNVNCGLPSYSDCLKDSKKNPKSSKNINSKKDLESNLCNKYQNMNLCNANQDNDTKKNKSSTEQLQEKILTGARELLPIICTMHHCCYKCHPPIEFFNHIHISCKFMNEKLKLCDANVQKINCNICDRQCAYAKDPKEN